MRIYTKRLVLKIDPELLINLKDISIKNQIPVSRIVRDVLKEKILKENQRNSVFERDI